MIGLGLPRGFLVTLKNFVRAPVTVQYPDRHVGLFGAAKEAGMNPFRFVVKRPVDSIKAIAGLATVPVALEDASLSAWIAASRSRCSLRRASSRFLSSCSVIATPLHPPRTLRPPNRTARPVLQYSGLPN